MLSLLLLLMSHTVNDMFGAFLQPLLPKIQAAFATSYAKVSFLVAAYSLSSSILQPFAGMIADRSDRRLLAAIGPMMVVLSCGLMGLYPNLLSLGIFLFLGGFGSALFHSSGAALVGENAPAKRKGLWLSVFGSSGNLGLMLGPAVSIPLVSTYGLNSLAWLVPFALIFPLALIISSPKRVRDYRKPSGFADLLRVFKGQIARLWGIGTMRNITFISLSTTIPYWFAQEGISDAYMATTLVVYNLAGTIGALSGGTISDYLGRKNVLLFSSIALLPLFALLMVLPPQGWLFLVILVLAAINMNSAIPVGVIMAQEHEPKQIATVSGLMMGFTWGFAGLLYGVVGPAVESFGVIPSLSVVGLLLIPSLIITLGVREASQN